MANTAVPGAPLTVFNLQTELFHQHIFPHLLTQDLASLQATCTLFQQMIKSHPESCNKLDPQKVFTQVKIWARKTPVYIDWKIVYQNPTMVSDDELHSFSMITVLRIARWLQTHGDLRVSPVELKIPILAVPYDTDRHPTLWLPAPDAYIFGMKGTSSYGKMDLKKISYFLWKIKGSPPHIDKKNTISLIATAWPHERAQALIKFVITSYLDSQKPKPRFSLR